MLLSKPFLLLPSIVSLGLQCLGWFKIWGDSCLHLNSLWIETEVDVNKKHLPDLGKGDVAPKEHPQVKLYMDLGMKLCWTPWHFAKADSGLEWGQHFQKPVPRSFWSHMGLCQASGLWERVIKMYKVLVNLVWGTSSRVTPASASWGCALDFVQLKAVIRKAV